MGPKRAAQCLVQQVCGRVVCPNGPAAGMIDRQGNPHTRGQRAAFHLRHMHKYAVYFLGVLHTGLTTLEGDHTAIAHLATGFGVKRRLVQHNLHRLARGGRGHAGPVLHQRQHLALGGFGIIAQKFGRAVLFGNIEPNRGICRLARACPSGARLGLLFGHGGIKAVGINSAALFAQRILGQIKRETKCIIELKGRSPRQRGLVGQVGQFVVQQFQAAIQGLLEPGFLQFQRFLDHRLRLAQFGVGIAHLCRQRAHKAVHHRVFGPQQMRMAHGAAHDAAQHIAAPVVRWHHPVGNQKRGRSQMVGNNTVVGFAGAIGRAIC